MNDDALLNALKSSDVPVEEEFLHDVTQFLAAIDRAANMPLEEAVPAEMMQVFTDDQWLDLLFEFQPGATIFSSGYDIATLHQGWMESGELLARQPVGDQYNWVIFSDTEGLVVKMLISEEFKALSLATNGKTFSEIAMFVWPELSEEASHEEMTRLVLAWLSDGLIIDAGVPLPEDARFE
ncbi:MAG: hypothetical protein KTR18_14145 [Acidiferrobacterales bacterium]|nr:hypothetical protein [Acidiferrobacterales bacterium]